MGGALGVCSARCAVVRIPLLSASAAHAAETAEGACAAGAYGNRIKGDLSLLVPDDDRVGLAELEGRGAERHGAEVTGRRIAEDLPARAVQDAHFSARLRAVAEVIERHALGGGVAEALRHGRAAAGDQLAARDHTASAVFAGVVDGVVAAGGGEADADDAARDDDICVGVDAVGIAGRCINDCEAAAGDMDPGFGDLCLDRCVVGRVAEGSEHAGSEAAEAAVGIQAVVGGIEFDLAAGDINGQGLDALITLADEDAAAGDADAAVGMDAVVRRADRERTARDREAAAAVDAVRVRAEFKAAAFDEQVSSALDGGAGAVNVKAAGGNVQERVRPLEVQAFVPRADFEGSLFDVQTVIDVDAVLGRVDGDAAAGDGQLVVDVNAMLVSRREREAAAAVDGEIVMTEDHAAGVVGQGRFGIRRAARHAVFGSVREGQEDLLRLLHAQARIVGAADVRPVEQDPDLGAAVGADDNAAVRERAGDHIASGLGDDHIAVIDVGSASGDRGAVPGERDARGAGRTPASVTVVSGEEGGIAAALRIPVHDGSEAEAFAVYERSGEQERTDKDGNANQINVLMR